MKLSNAVILTLQRMRLEKDEILHLAKEAEAYQTIANNEEWAIFILKHSLVLEPHDADACWPMYQLLLEKEIDDGDALLLKQKKEGIDTFSFQSENYPKPFLNTTDFPPLIHTLGDTRLLHNAPKVAIIGARSADQKGNEAAYKLGVAYAQKGSVVVRQGDFGMEIPCQKRKE
ncbi:MAG: DNA-processing protein DprA [Bacteroidales bacterium]